MKKMKAGKGDQPLKAVEPGINLVAAKRQTLWQDVTGAYAFGGDTPEFASMIKMARFLSAPVLLEKVSLCPLKLIFSS
jgi:hypothetical protein